MTDFISLESAASGAALVCMIIFLVAYEDNEHVGKMLRDQLREIGRVLWYVPGVPIQMLLVLAGILTYWGVVTGRLAIAAVGSLIGLWSMPVFRWAKGRQEKIGEYLDLRRYRGAHCR